MSEESPRIKSPLGRQVLRNHPDRVECVACGGSGLKSRPGPGQPPECAACGGSGSQLMVVPTPAASGTESSEAVPHDTSAQDHSPGTETEEAVPHHLSRTENTEPVRVKEQPMSKPVQHSSDSNEFYTPAPIVEAARRLMGSIDLDPASCEIAQQVVKAERWFSAEDDGLRFAWERNVFLNPPGGKVPEEYKGMGTQSFSTLFWAKLAEEWRVGAIEQALFVGFTLEILRSAQNIEGIPQPLDFHFCVPKSRIAFDTINRAVKRGKRKGELINPTKPAGVRIETDSPGHANVLIWLPPVASADRLSLARSDTWLGVFKNEFEQFGKCR